MNVEDDVVVDGQSEEESDETKLLLRLEGGGVEPVDPRVLVVYEQSCIDQGRGRGTWQGGWERGEGDGNMARRMGTW